MSIYVQLTYSYWFKINDSYYYDVLLGTVER